LWQEGHTAHATEAQARAYALQILRDVYVSAMEEVGAVPVLTGLKTERERFAGAIRTWTCEGMMGDGKALQMGTSHELGQNFARAFGIEFADESGDRQHVWQTSWGVSTRLIGAFVMAHGDDHGLRLPPALAPVEVVVLVVRDDEAVQAAARGLTEELRRAGHRVRLDDRTDTGFGRRTVDWELKGVPVRLEVGPRDLAEGNVTVVTRHRLTKETLPLAAAAAQVTAILGRVADELRAEALAVRAARTVDVADLEEAAQAAATGFARVPWKAVGAAGEDRLGRDALSVRCLQRADGTLPGTADDEDSWVAVIGRSY
jgi:prolyl-tRNA synthetase